MVLNRDGLVFIGRRLDKNHAEHSAPGYEWQMPQGGIDADEEPREAAMRELYEETNIKSVEYLAESPDWYAYDLPDDVSLKAWKGRYRGQKQKWFAFRFLGDEAEINIHEPGGAEKPEFDAWRWEEMARLPNLIIPFKREVYVKVVEGFAHLGR
jgi:putative (di)nucleoside polyphosphate hydrolase